MRALIIAALLSVSPACQLHAQGTVASTQEWLVQAMWLGTDQVPFDTDLPRQTHPDALAAKRAAVLWCSTLASLKAVPKIAIKEAFRAPGDETGMPYKVCKLDAYTYVSVFGFKK